MILVIMYVGHGLFRPVHGSSYIFSLSVCLEEVLSSQIEEPQKQDALSWDGRRWEQRPRSGTRWEVAVGDEIYFSRPGPLPTRPYFPDPTITARSPAFFLCFLPFQI